MVVLGEDTLNVGDEVWEGDVLGTGPGIAVDVDNVVVDCGV